MNKEAFLPDNYQIPSSSGRYMKFQAGDNRFRILSSPIIGNEYWTLRDGVKKPVRKRMGEAIDVSDIALDQKSGKQGKVSHFWAMPIYDYADGIIKVLELTQKGIQASIKALAADEDWGSPLNYDLVVTRTGEGIETEYSVRQKPAKPTEKHIIDQFEELKAQGFNLEALFSGGDPFTGSVPESNQVSIEEIDIEDITI